MGNTLPAFSFSPFKEQHLPDMVHSSCKMPTQETTTEDGARKQKVTKSEDMGGGENFSMTECEVENVLLSDPKAVSQTHGGIETFGKGLTSNGLYGASITNPDNMQNNCVSVSIAKCMEFADVKELWQHTYGHSLPDRPLRVHEIEDLIRRTGWNFHWVLYVPEKGKNAYEVLLKRRHQLDFAKYGPISAAAYVRSDGSGHCVVLTSREIAAPLCYQHADDGRYITQELRAATSIIVFHLRCPRNTTFFSEWQNRMLFRILENREKRRGWSINRHTYRLYCQELEPDKQMSFKSWCEVSKSLGISDEEGSNGDDDVDNGGGAADGAGHKSRAENEDYRPVEDGAPHTSVRAKL